MVVPYEVVWALKPEALCRSHPSTVPAVLQGTFTLLQLYPDPQCWWPADLQSSTSGFRQGNSYPRRYSPCTDSPCGLQHCRVVPCTALLIAGTTLLFLLHTLGEAGSVSASVHCVVRWSCVRRVFFFLVAQVCSQLFCLFFVISY